MALHDVDPRSLDRGSPMPSKHDVQVSGQMNHRTKSTNYVTDASNLAQVAGAYNGQLNVVSVMRIPLTLFTFTGGDASAFGAQSVLVIKQQHNLPYVPGVRAYTDYSSFEGGYDPLPSASFGGYAPSLKAAFWYEFRVAVDATYVYIYADIITFAIASTSSETPPFIIYLLEQRPS